MGGKAGAQTHWLFTSKQAQQFLAFCRLEGCKTQLFFTSQDFTMQFRSRVFLQRPLPTLDTHPSEDPLSNTSVFDLTTPSFSMWLSCPCRQPQRHMGLEICIMQPLPKKVVKIGLIFPWENLAQVLSMHKWGKG